MYTKGFLHTLPTILHSSIVQQFSKQRCADACSSLIVFSFKKYTVFSNKSLFKY